jgi:hypothetical protein
MTKKRTDYGYGRANNKLIWADAAILARFATLEQIQKGQFDNELWEKFKAAGGDAGHSGGSWQCVRHAAYQLLSERLAAS